MGYTYSIEGTANTPVTINTFTYQDITTSGNKALKVQTKDLLVYCRLPSLPSFILSPSFWFGLLPIQNAGLEITWNKLYKRPTSKSDKRIF